MAKKLLFLIFSCVLCSACAAYAPYYGFDSDSDFSKGVSAFNAGNFVTARTYLAPYAQEGNPDAQYLLGLMALNALGENINVFEAEKQFENAANQGHIPAQIQIAYLYKDTRYPIYNPAQSYYWFAVLSQNIPDYEAQMNNLNWTLNGDVPRKIKKIKPCKSLNFNQLYPAR